MRAGEDLGLQKAQIDEGHLSNPASTKSLSATGAVLSSYLLYAIITTISSELWSPPAIPFYTSVLVSWRVLFTVTRRLLK